MSALNIVLYVVVIINAILLIGLILIQQSKGGGFGATFGGVGESVFGARASNHLTKLTVILTTVFFVLTLLLVVIRGNLDESSPIKFSNNNGVQTAPAVKTGPVNATPPAKK